MNRRELLKTLGATAVAPMAIHLEDWVTPTPEEQGFLRFHPMKKARTPRVAGFLIGMMPVRVGQLGFWLRDDAMGRQVRAASLILKVRPAEIREVWGRLELTPGGPLDLPAGRIVAVTCADLFGVFEGSGPFPDNGKKASDSFDCL